MYFQVPMGDLYIQAWQYLYWVKIKIDKLYYLPSMLQLKNTNTNKCYTLCYLHILFFNISLTFTSKNGRRPKIYMLIYYYPDLSQLMIDLWFLERIHFYWRIKRGRPWLLITSFFKIKINMSFYLFMYDINTLYVYCIINSNQKVLRSVIKQFLHLIFA